jgi:hypothetical protein
MSLSRRSIAIFAAAFAFGVPACGESDVERGAEDAGREAREAGRDAEKAGEDAKREAEREAER